MNCILKIGSYSASKFFLTIEEATTISKMLAGKCVSYESNNSYKQSGDNISIEIDSSISLIAEKDDETAENENKTAGA